MITNTKPYINLKLSQYEGIEPFFYDDIEFNWCNTLKENFELIKTEFLDVYNQKLKTATNKVSLEKHQGWNQMELIVYGMFKEKNINLFPKTFNLIKNIDNISTCYFSILEPNTQIKPHIGDTDAFYRFHLGIIIPDGLPTCGIQVGPEKKAWIEKDFIVFNDVYKHTAWNNSDKTRVVLIIDVLREFDNVKKIDVESDVLSALAFSRLTNYFLIIFELMPKILIRLMLFCFKNIFKFKLSSQKKFY